MNLEQVRSQNDIHPNVNHVRAAHRFIAEVNHVITNLQFKGDTLPIRYRVTQYVIPGCEFEIGQYRFWLGVNGKRITFVSNLDAEHKAVFDTFYSAITRYTHGWEWACYPLGTKANLRCVIEAEGSLVIPNRPAGMTYGETPMQVTDEGNFYAHEVAQFIQCFIKVMQSNQLECAITPPSNI